MGNISKQSAPKKHCQGDCKKERALNFFYKVDSPLFPDGHLNICRDCLRDSIDVDDVQEVIDFLRQIDKPFHKQEWDKALDKRDKRHPIGSYIKTLSLQQYKGETFKDSDGVEGAFNVDLKSIKSDDEIKTEAGEVITFDEKLFVSRWGVGYKKYEYLSLEKFYQDMLDSYEVVTANHKKMLIQLAKLTLEMDRLLSAQDFTNYQKVSNVYDNLLKSAGFRPVDRKNGAESTGIFSFSQVWAEIEKEGFVPPKMVEYPKDDVDYMLLYYIQFTQRLVGKSVSTEPPKNWRDEVIVDGE